MTLSKLDISNYIVKNFNHIVPTNTWGELSFFINPDMKLKKGSYFCTIKEKDGENDKASNLNRDDVYRLNIGITKKTFQNLFGKLPIRPAKSQIILGDYDFTLLDKLMPHPIYGWMGWVAINNPSQQSFSNILPYLNEAYEKALNITYKKLSS